MKPSCRPCAGAYVPRCSTCHAVDFEFKELLRLRVAVVHRKEQLCDFQSRSSAQLGVPLDLEGVRWLVDSPDVAIEHQLLLAAACDFLAPRRAQEARAVEAEKRMIAAEKRGTEGEKRLREETERLRSHAELRVAESERLAKEVRTSRTAFVARMQCPSLKPGWREFAGDG